MKCIVLTDIHGERSKFKKISAELQNCDYVLITGDITHFGNSIEIEKTIKKLARFNSNILAVSGNCDYPETDEYLDKLGINVASREHKLKEYTFIGLNGSLPCPGKTPNEYTEEHYAARCEKYSKTISDFSNVILLSHQPPANTVNDKVSDLMHVGSNSIRNFIEDYQPLLCLCGHIHEGIGTDKIGNTQTLNPGPFMHNKYALLKLNKKQVAIELKSF